MEPVYHLTVNIQTPKGMLEIGKFFLGTDNTFAKETFAQMEGSEDLLKYPSIRLDLISTTAGMLPVCQQRIGCNLDQYAVNCRTLTREAFRHFMFEGDTIL